MIELIHTGPTGENGGFMGRPAAPVFDNGRLRTVGPFIVVGHSFATTLEAHVLPKDKDVRPHPHIGIATLSYLFAGEMTHRDGLGFTQVIKPGEVNWMNSGSGVVHSERYDGLRARGGPMHGLQIWVALPERDEDKAPSFDHFSAREIPSGDEGGVRTKVVAGEAFGVRSPVRALSPLYFAHHGLDVGARFAAPAQYEERAVYVISGALDAGGTRIEAGQTALLAPGADADFTALEATDALSFGGAPIGPRFLWWNLVSSRKERIEDAKTDWKAGRFKLPADDSAEFIPLPEDHERALMTLNV